MSHGKQGKVWGQTIELLNTPLIEVHHILIDAKRQCSMHKHEFKWNMFYVIRGTLVIEVQKNDYDLLDETELHAGEWCSVRPNEFHLFRSVTDVEALEIYYLEPLTKDIIRKDVGGIVETEK